MGLVAAVLTGSWAPADWIDVSAQPGDEQDAALYVRGILAARAAWPGGKAEPLRIAATAADTLDARASAGGRWNRREVRRISVLAAIAAAQEERDEASLLLTHAGHLDTQLRDAGLPTTTCCRWRNWRGNLWLQVDRYETRSETTGSRRPLTRSALVPGSDWRAPRAPRNIPLMRAPPRSRY